MPKNRRGRLTRPPYRCGRAAIPNGSLVAVEMQATETPERLVEGYRERIAALDERLVALYARRRELVRELFAFKDRHGLPRYDPEQEERVVARARRIASEIGGRPEEAARLVRWILGEGRDDPTGSLAAAGAGASEGRPASRPARGARGKPPASSGPSGRLDGQP